MRQEPQMVIRRRLSTTVICLEFSLLASAAAGQSVDSVWINGKRSNSWNFYPGNYAFLKVFTDKPADGMQNYILYLENIPISKITPVLPVQGNTLNYRFDFQDQRQLDAWKSFFHAVEGKATNTYHLTVGPESGVPLKTSADLSIKVQLIEPDRESWVWGVAIGFLALLGVLILFTDLFRDPNPLVGIPEKKKPYSLSRIQFGIWNMLILYGVFYIFTLTGKLLSVPAQLLGLLGISGTQFMIGWALTKTDNPAYQASVTTGNIVKDIVLSDVNEGLHRYQNILWAVAIWIYLIYSLIVNVDYPAIDPQLLVLTGFTSSVYLYGKTKETAKVDPKE